MGQGSSRPQRGSQRTSPEHEIGRHGYTADGTSWRDNISSPFNEVVPDFQNANRHAHTQMRPASRIFDGQSQGRPRTHMRSNSAANRLSRLLHSSTDAPPTTDAGTSRPSALQRSRTTLSNMFRREDAGNPRSRQPRRPTLRPRSSYRSFMPASAADDEEGEYYPPRLPSIEQTATFDHDLFGASEHDALSRSSSSQRVQNRRLNALRPDRPLRSITSSFRRRRSPTPPEYEPPRQPERREDQATMLSRLLSIAAAATAASLMGHDQHALREARSLIGGTGFGNMNESEEDGSFDGFLRALQNGRIASALRQGENGQEPGENGQAAEPLNFFRMFRFGAQGPSDAQGPHENAEERTLSEPQEQNDGPTYGTDAQMVPIIIVGIRSISPNGNSSSNSVDELPPFMEAMGANFSQPHTTYDHESIDSILRPPQNGTSFRHRRRASMGGLGMGRSRIDERYDAQRDHRSPDRRRERPWSMASSGSHYEPRPPPATPASASPELSRISSRNTTPSHSRPTSLIASSLREFASESRRNSALHRSAASPLSSHTEESVSLHSSRSSDNLLSHRQPHERDSFRGHRRSDTAPNIHYPRFASGHPRRNGVVEPDHLPPLSRSSTSNATDTTAGDNAGGARDDGRRSSDSRSWIIYVLGGSYPENHPILSTPSLFTENPTYEDMMLLSTLLGPGKPPVATEEDVQSAGGVYDIVVVEQPATTTAHQSPSDSQSRLVAVATADTDKGANPERVFLQADQNCLVCLSEFEVEDVARRLGQCGHLFHKECIDQWLTQGRNSCPLCRGQGVNETEKPAADSPAAESVAASGEGEPGVAL